jgi:hypothetical protein
VGRPQAKTTVSGQFRSYPASVTLLPVCAPGCQPRTFSMHTWNAEGQANSIRLTVPCRRNFVPARYFARGLASGLTHRALGILGPSGERSTARISKWCERYGLSPLPASVETVAAYLAHLAQSAMKASSITRRCAGLRYMHRMAGHEPPTNSESIKAVFARWHPALAWHSARAEGASDGRGDRGHAGGDAGRQPQRAP